MVKVQTKRSILNWNSDPSQGVENVEPLPPGTNQQDESGGPSSPVQPNSPVRSPSLAQKSPEISRTFSAPSAPLPKKKKQLSHTEVLKEYDGPGRSDECIKKSIEFFSTCDNLV